MITKSRVILTLAVALASAGSALAGASNGKTQSFNQSSRAYVQTGDNVLIGGIIVGGNDSVVAVIRALGPSVNVPNRLQNPTLELHGPGFVVSQDSYLENNATDLATLQRTGLTPSNANEAAIVRRLAPGAYTAIVRGANGTVGNALVEFYKIQ